MMADTLRLTSHPVLEITSRNRRSITIIVDGHTIKAIEGETLAAALWANGIFSLRHDEVTGSARGMFCGIGHCYECRVTVDGVEDIRSCLIRVREGMHVSLKRPVLGKSDDHDS